jgi:hypothetical protein
MDNGTSPGEKAFEEMSVYIPRGCAQTIWSCLRPEKKKVAPLLPINSHDRQ